MGEADGDRFAAQAAELVIAVAEPPRGGGVGRHALRHQRRQAFRLACLFRAEQRDGLIRRQRIGDVAEVDAPDEFLRRHIHQQAPQRFALLFRPQIPHRIDHRRGGEVDDAFFWADPAQLRIAGDMPPERTHVTGERFERAADDQRFQRFDRGDTQFIATPDGEGQAMAGERAVGVQDDVGRRVIGIGIHRVRAVAIA